VLVTQKRKTPKTLNPYFTYLQATLFTL